MELPDNELLNFWNGLNKTNVRYILVGDYAATLHGHHHFTNVMQIWLEDTLQNRKNLRMAFIELGYGDLPSLETMQFVPGWTSIYINNVIELDIMTELKGVYESFDECLAIASLANLENTLVPFLHINQLIANKKSVNRPKDQMDVTALEEIKRIREEE